MVSSLALGSGYQITALGVTWDFFFSLLQSEPNDEGIKKNDFPFVSWKSP